MSTEIPEISQFATELTKVILERMPENVLETGTYKGTGSSRIILNALGRLKGQRNFYTIEVNQDFAHDARVNLSLDCPSNVGVFVLNGLSVPYDMLPNASEIEARIKEAKEGGFKVDHDGKDEVFHYTVETQIAPFVSEKILDGILELEPEVILLDSAAHMGELEFVYVKNRLRWPCILALDDTCHMKHYKSLQRIKENPKFKLLVESNERFGFAITEYNP